MKKIYNNLIGISLVSLLCAGLSIPAYAQRGSDHSSGSSGNNGSTPPPAAPAPRPAPQVQRSNPQPQAQHGSPRPQQTQRSGTQNAYQRQAAVNAPGSQPRGVQHQAAPVFTRPDAGPRRYPTIGSARPTYIPRGNGGSYRNGYRSYPGMRFGHNYVSPRPGGFYFQNRGYYRTYYTPQLGFRINILPRGYYPFYFGPDQYFYSDGLYYRQEDNDYTVVEPPIGASIEKLPANAQSIAINGMQYYELNGVYYQPVTRDDGTVVYQIAGKDGELNIDSGSVSGAQDDLPQIGDLVDTLPEGCKILKLAGQKYYVSQEGYYFQDAVDTNGDKVFKIVGTPTDEPGN
ncbi:DUF6515 family protein [Mucilaginibacter sp. dw_454]|uniref:DUF6515 family protein n=1 Tax=Mucilaginibacter sp. dw_454 TaxID=2720079 RepID=UPI001BD290AF|nr:DUF6515 family protein [Mucilaginibacter sp. dw_454]